MLKSTCIMCKKPSVLSYQDKLNHSGRCQSCQLNHDIDHANTRITQIQATKDLMLPEIRQLLQTKIDTEITSTHAREVYIQAVQLFERLDRTQAELKHQRDLDTGKKTLKVRQPKKSRKAQQSAKAQALRALNNLDPATKALVLAQLNEDPN